MTNGRNHGRPDKYSVGIIGLGRIASTYGKPQNPFSYCHAGGILQSDRVVLAAVADLSEQRREAFRTLWGEALGGFAEFSTFADMWRERPVDIVSICVRGPEHYELAREVIEAGPRHIFLEKPPTCSLDEADRLVAAAAAKGVKITVSYSRHWSPVNLRMQELVRQGLIGKVHTVIGYADHAFLSSASHGMDALCQFAGYDPVAVYAVGTPGTNTREGYEPEPGLTSAVIEYRSGATGILVGKAGEHGVFYVDVLGEKGHVRSGMYTAPAAWIDKKPVAPSQFGMPENASVFKMAYGQIADFLDGGRLPDCTEAAWHAVNEIGFAGIESLLSGRRVEIPTPQRSRRIFANG